MKSLAGKRVLVVGLGKSGVAACRLLVALKARVYVTDETPKARLKSSLKQLPKDVIVEAGGKKFFTLPFDLIVVSPGVAWDHPALKSARKRRTPVWPELELGWRFCKPAKTIAVTGTNGKTTTTTLVGEILKKAGRPVLVGGNIGTPLSALAEKITNKTYLVLEVSSYQLEGHGTFHPDVSILLNITPDHLARHKTMKRYAEAKARVMELATPKDTFIYNAQDKWCREIALRTKAKRVPFPAPALLSLASHTKLPGQHNLENAMAAAAAARAVGIDDDAISAAIKSFQGVKHRIQIVARKKGVLYVNDSKATNVDSTLVALKSFSDPIVLLLGGEHKGSPYTPLLPLIRLRVKQVIAYGESQAIIEKDLGKQANVVRCKDLVQAVKRASSVAKSGDVVLLSPACASFDQYNNYEERGDHFISLVKALRG